MLGEVYHKDQIQSQPLRQGAQVLYCNAYTHWFILQRPGPIPLAHDYVVYKPYISLVIIGPVKIQTLQLQDQYQMNLRMHPQISR